jgi:hypothetical protein
MIPRCIKLDCRKLRSGSVFEHGCGIRTTSSGWPLPGEDETVLGRWNVIGSRLFIDMKDDPGYGAYITDGSLGILVTDKALRGSFYDGKGHAGKLKIVRDVFTFYWPYSLMAEPRVSHYQDDRRTHILIEDPEQDGHLGLQGITKPKGTKPDDFLSPVLSVKNRAPEFLAQVVKARERFCAGSGIGGAPGAEDGTTSTDHHAERPGGASDEQPGYGEPSRPAGSQLPTAIDTGIGGTRFFDLATVADPASTEPVDLSCASCGGEIEEEDRFCPSCGQDLTVS